MIGTTASMETDESDKFSKVFFEKLASETQRNLPIKECLRETIEKVIVEKPQLLERFVVIGDINQCFQCGRMED